MSHGWVEAIAATVSAFFALVAIGVSIVAMRRLDGLGARLARQREDFDKKLSGGQRDYICSGQRCSIFGSTFLSLMASIRMTLSHRIL